MATERATIPRRHRVRRFRGRVSAGRVWGVWYLTRTLAMLRWAGRATGSGGGSGGGGETGWTV